MKKQPEQMFTKYLTNEFYPGLGRPSAPVARRKEDRRERRAAESISASRYCIGELRVPPSPRNGRTESVQPERMKITGLWTPLHGR